MNEGETASAPADIMALAEQAAEGEALDAPARALPRVVRLRRKAELVEAQKQQAAPKAASSSRAVLSYSPETLDKDFSTEKSHLTGDFLNYYNQFTKEIVAPAARQKSVKTSAVVLRKALAEFHPNSATALLFVNQTTQSKDRPEPTLTSSSVPVELTKAGGQWLISSFNPV